MAKKQQTQAEAQAELKSYLGNPNVQRALYAIRMAEGTQNQPGEGAGTLVGYGQFSDMSRHPNQLVKVRPGLNSTAAGKYQIIKRTWDGLQKQYGFSDFSPETQDLAAVALIKQRGALEAAAQGDWDAFIPKVGREWASFPDNDYKQGGPGRQKILGYLGVDPTSIPAPKPLPRYAETNVTPSVPDLTAGWGQSPTSSAPPSPSPFSQPLPEAMSLKVNGESVLGVPETDEEAKLAKAAEPYDHDTRGRLFALLDSLGKAEQSIPMIGGDAFGRAKTPDGKIAPDYFDDRLLKLIDQV